MVKESWSVKTIPPLHCAKKQEEVEIEDRCEVHETGRVGEHSAVTCGLERKYHVQRDRLSFLERHG